MNQPRLRGEVVAADPERGRACLVPGNDLGAAFYRPLAAELAARGLSTTLITLPGFLDAPALADPGWEGYLEALRGELAAQPGRLLVGHSLGGLLAFLCLAREPALAPGLVLLEPFLLPWRGLARRAARSYLAQDPAPDFVNWTGSYRRVHDLDRFPRWAIEHYEAVRRDSQPPPARALLGQLEQLYPLPFARVTAPVLILRGARTGWRNALAHTLLRWRFRDARLEAIPDAAHWLANEQDARVAAAVASFAARLEPAS